MVVGRLTRQSDECSAYVYIAIDCYASLRFASNGSLIQFFNGLKKYAYVEGEAKISQCSLCIPPLADCVLRG